MQKVTRHGRLSNRALCWGLSNSGTVTILIAIVLAMHAGLLACAAARHSPTCDEVSHLVAGISHWHLGRFDLYRVNPPLVRLVAGAAVIPAKPNTCWRFYDEGVGQRSERTIRKDFAVANGCRTFSLFFVARRACIPFALLGGLICFLWARELYGQAAGVIALTLWCFSPNILAHASLITPDAGAAAMGVTAGYAFWRWLRQPGWAEAFLAGAALGLAELTKATWIVLFALWPTVWLVRFFWKKNTGNQHQKMLRPDPKTTAACRWQACQLVVILLLGVYVLNLGYGFESTFQRLGEYRFVSLALGGPRDDVDRFGEGSNRFSGTWLANLPVPLPKNYVMGIDLQRWDFERKMWSYLRGQWRLGGWWYYYLYALAIKVPLGTWILILVALLLGLLGRGYAAPWSEELVLLAPIAVVLLLVSSQTGFNHHMRYVLPAFPFAFIWASKVARVFTLSPAGWPRRVLGGVVAAALSWSVASSLWIYPHSLSYFNELVGGPRHGHEHLLDSNIDWGQDLLYLKRWYDRHPEARAIHLADWNCWNARIAGIQYVEVPPGLEATQNGSENLSEMGPQPGWYALSVNEIHRRDGRYGYFRHLEPVATAGYSIYIYHITPDEANRVRCQLGLPELP